MSTRTMFRKSPPDGVIEIAFLFGSISCARLNPELTNALTTSSIDLQFCSWSESFGAVRNAPPQNSLFCVPHIQCLSVQTKSPMGKNAYDSVRTYERTNVRTYERTNVRTSRRLGACPTTITLYLLCAVTLPLSPPHSTPPLGCPGRAGTCAGARASCTARR